MEPVLTLLIFVVIFCQPKIIQNKLTINKYYDEYDYKSLRFILRFMRVDTSKDMNGDIYLDDNLHGKFTLQAGAREFCIQSSLKADYGCVAIKKVEVINYQEEIHGEFAIFDIRNVQDYYYLQKTMSLCGK